MNKIMKLKFALIVLTFLTLGALSADTINAQTVSSRQEGSLAYQYQNIDDGQLNVTTGNTERAAAQGYKVDYGFNFKNNVSFIAEHSGAFNTRRQFDNNFRTHIEKYDFLSGARYNFRNESKVTPFVQSTIGAAYARTRLENLVANTNLKDTNTAFAWTAGGGMDVRLSKVTSRDVRVRFGADYNPTYFNDTTQHTGRFSIGFVIGNK